MYTIRDNRKATPLRFRNLTVFEKTVLCNGCGSKGGWFNPPDYVFPESCNQHDFNYWIGGTEEDRKKADLQFYTSMKEAVAATSFWLRWYYYGAAWRYYQAVYWMGKKHFETKIKTWEDLEEAVNTVSLDKLQ